MCINYVCSDDPGGDYVCSDDPGGDYPNTRLVLQELCINDVTLDDCRHVQHVCWQVSQRAAHLAATGNCLIQVMSLYT